MQILTLKRAALKTLLWSKKPLGIKHVLDNIYELQLQAEEIPFDDTLEITQEEETRLGRYTRESHDEHMAATIQRLRNLKTSCDEALDDIKLQTSDMHAVVAFLMACFELRHNKCFQYLLVKSGKVPQGTKLHRQLRKLSRYRQIVHDLVSNVNFLREFECIEVEQVSTTSPIKPDLRSQSLVNALQSLNLEPRAKTKSMEQGFQALRKKPLHVHAEVELVTFYTSRGRKPSPFIGCSKLACFLCNMFLQFHPQFQMRGTHRKLYTGWTLPAIQNTPHTIKNIVTKMCKELESTIARVMTPDVASPRKHFLPPDSVSGVSETVVMPKTRTDPQGFSISMSSYLEHVRGTWHSLVGTSNDDEEKDDSSTIPDTNSNQYDVQPSSQPNTRMCKDCEFESPAVFPCPHCKNVWYCSKYCMEGDRPHHVFVCSVPITSADYLHLAIIKDIFPTGEAAEDFGFSNTKNAHDRAHLAGLYKGLLFYLKVSSQSLHEWQRSGTLVEKICETYEALRARSPNSIGGYYPWFLENKHLIQPSHPPVPELPAVEFIHQQAQSYLPSADRGTSLPESKKIVSMFYGLLRGDWHPGPADGTDLWRSFGFWVCKDQFEETGLAFFWRNLFSRATFVQFHQAYLDGTLDRLAIKVGMEREVGAWKRRGAVLGLKPGAPHPSAYDLKEFVASDQDIPKVPSLQVDYGYFNCKNPHERRLWRETYAKMFMAESFDFEKLHQACIQGKLYEYVKAVCPETPKTFRRLAKNLYPLPDY